MGSFFTNSRKTGQAGRFALFFRAFAAIAAASVRPPILPVGAWIGFGILIPLRHGVDFLDARMILAYAFIPMLFVASPVALGIAYVRQSAAMLYAWISAATIFGWCVGFVFLTTALATINLVFRLMPLQLPESGVLPLFAVFSFCAVWFITSCAAFLAFLFTPNASRQVLRFGFLVLLLAFYLGPRVLPGELEFELGQIEPKEGVAWTAILLALAAAGLTNALRAAVVVIGPEAISTNVEPSS